MAKKFRKIARTEEIREKIESPFGIKYIIDGQMKFSNGESVTVRTVWIIETGQNIPRFVTAYPV